MGPTCVARLDVTPRIVLLPEGVLLCCVVRDADGRQEVAARRSTDNGVTWSEPEPLFPLDPEPGGWAGCECLVDREGELHVFLLNDRHTGVVRDARGEGEKRCLELGGPKLDIWHARTLEGRRRWTAPAMIWQGYTGALNSVIQMRRGRILLPFSCMSARSWAQRGEGLDAFTFMGGFDSTLVYSDDGGRMWRQSPARLKVQTPEITGSYGAVEPVVIELDDGRVWMLIRTQKGRFYESFSTDGVAWSRPRPTHILSSDSPAGLVRLPNRRIVLLWNACLRFPYALGGRHVLHAAISDDEGSTWRGLREVARDPRRDEPPPPGGDHGTAYPFPALTADGHVIFSTGQGAGRVCIVRLDPDWLLETEQRDDFSAGLEEWSTFGAKGVGLVPHPDRAGARALEVRRADAEFPACAVWNFPCGASGSLKMRVRPAEGLNCALMLTDHFSVPFDDEDEINALFSMRVRAGVPMTPGRWHDLSLEWNCAKQTCHLWCDGLELHALRQQHAGCGVCYLRVRSLAEEPEPAGLLIEGVHVDVVPPGRGFAAGVVP